MTGPAEIVHGPMLIGLMFNILLYGTMIAQVYIYYSTYKEDKLWMKILVLLILIADTANTVFDFIYLYRSLIIHFGDVNFLAFADWFCSTDPALTGIIACAVQLFFAWRLGTLTRSWFLVIVICLGALSGGAGGIATSFEISRTPRFSQSRNFEPVVILWLASAAATDVIITTILVWFLRKHKSGFKNSDLVVDRIIRLTVQTGLITSLVAIVDLIFYLEFPTGLHLMFNLPLCKLYSNSLMSSFNSRRGYRWRFGSSNDQESHMHSSSGNFGISLTNRPPSVLNHDFPMSPLDKFSSDDGTFTSHAKKLYPGHKHNPGIVIPPSAIHLEKSVRRPEVTIHVESHQMRDSIGGKRQQLPNQQAMNVVLPIDAETDQRLSSRGTVEETENIYEEPIQLMHRDTIGSRCYPPRS